ncbi:MAG: hypothetical protein V4722_07725 [Bacteroidota bacterium]
MKKLLFTLLFIAGSFVYVYSQDSLQQYTGRYNFPEGSVVREINVTVENNALMMGSMMGNANLVKDSEDNFRMPGFNGLAMFKRDSNKKVNTVSIDVMGLKLEGIKETSATPGSSADQPIIIIWERKLLTSP